MTSGDATEEFLRLNPYMYSFLVDNNNEHKKAKGVNRNVVNIHVLMNINMYC